MKIFFSLYLTVFLLIVAGYGKIDAEEPKKEEPLFNSSLHHEAVYQNYKEGKWIPIENPLMPKMYAAFGEPLSAEQLKKLAMPMGRK